MHCVLNYCKTDKSVEIPDIQELLIINRGSENVSFQRQSYD